MHHANPLKIAKLRNYFLAALAVLTSGGLATDKAIAATYQYRVALAATNIYQTPCTANPVVLYGTAEGKAIPVPKNCTLASITLEGSGGGNAGAYIGGSGAKITLTLSGLKPGEFLHYGMGPAGKAGSNTHGGGGGGSAYVSLAGATSVSGGEFLVYAGGGGGAGAAGYGEPGHNGGNAFLNTTNTGANLGNSPSYYGGIATTTNGGYGGASSGVGGGGGAGFFGGWGGYGNTFGAVTGSGDGGVGFVQSGYNDCDNDTAAYCAKTGHQRGGNGGSSFIGGFSPGTAGTSVSGTNYTGYSAAPQVLPGSDFPGLAVLGISVGSAVNPGKYGYVKISWN